MDRPRLACVRQELTGALRSDPQRLVSRFNPVRKLSFNFGRKKVTSFLDVRFPGFGNDELDGTVHAIPNANSKAAFFQRLPPDRFCRRFVLFHAATGKERSIGGLYHRELTVTVQNERIRTRTNDATRRFGTGAKLTNGLPFTHRVLPCAREDNDGTQQKGPPVWNIPAIRSETLMRLFVARRRYDRLNEL
jgi:hypothetical protein